jgi:hypothetical protein
LYNRINKRGERKMRITVEHKYCKYIKIVEGNSLYDAFKKNDLDVRVWNVIDIEMITE